MCSWILDQADVWISMDIKKHQEWIWFSSSNEQATNILLTSWTDVAGLLMVSFKNPPNVIVNKGSHIGVLILQSFKFILGNLSPSL